MNEREALEKARTAYSASQVQHGLPPLSEGESCVFEAGWEAAIEYCKSLTPAPRSRAKKRRIEEELRASDLTAQAAGRTDVEYGHHESLPRGEHVARMGGAKP